MTVDCHKRIKKRICACASSTAADKRGFVTGALCLSCSIRFHNLIQTVTPFFSPTVGSIVPKDIFCQSASIIVWSSSTSFSVIICASETTGNMEMAPNDTTDQSSFSNTSQYPDERCVSCIFFSAIASLSIAEYLITIFLIDTTCWF